MARVNREAEFLDLVYGAAIEPDRWSGVLEGTTGLMGAASANITFQDQVTGQGRAAVFGTDPKFFDSYFGYYATRNPLLRITDFPMALRIVTDEDKLPKNELVRSEYYNDFLTLMEAHSILMFRLAIEGQNTTVLNLVRPANRERFDGQDLETARRLHPHLIRAFQLASKLANMEGLKDRFEDFAGASANALFVVNAKGRLLYTNRAGETMFASGGGFTISNGVLRATDTDGTRALHTLIGAAGAVDADKRKGGEMALARTDGRRPLSITVVPARSPGISLFQSEPSVLICAIDPGANVVVPEQRLRDLFGLSRAEARLALQLLNGHDAKTAAKRLGLSYNTVRAHLVRMMAKTGTNRQAELIRIMMCSHE